MGNKILFINAVIFLFIALLALASMFTRPITYTYEERDDLPGRTNGDRDIMIALGWPLNDIHTVTEQPNYFGGLAATLIVSTAGFAYSLHQWDKSKGNDALQSKSEGVDD